MTKVLYNGEYIDLGDEFEKGYMEFDLLEPKKEKLEDTLELKKINLEDTKEFDFSNLEDTKEFDLGDLNGK